MMTFEAFFLKKKIDLVALKATKPDLYAEFKKHYALMGDKSFDHSKKYWFNQLRLSHHLSEEDEIRLKTEISPTKEVKPAIEENPVAATNPTTINSGFKPRFRAGNMPAKPKED